MGTRPGKVDVRFVGESALAAELAPATRRRVRPEALCAALLAALVLLTFGPPLLLVPHQAGGDLRQPASGESSVVRTWSPGTHSAVPVADTLRLAAGGLPRPSPLALRGANVALHAANVLLLWILLRRIAPAPAAMSAAALFAVLPPHARSVAGIAHQPVLIGTCFYLIALILFTRSSTPPPRPDANDDVDEVTAHATGARLGPFAAATFLVVAALTMLSHPVGLTLPLAAAGVARWRGVTLRDVRPTLVAIAILACGAGAWIALAGRSSDAISPRSFAYPILAALFGIAAATLSRAFPSAPASLRRVALLGTGAAVGALACVTLALGPERADALVAQARVELGDRGDAHAALVHLRRALEIDPSNRAALLGVAEAHQLLRQTDKAVMACRQLLALDPGHGDARLLLGILLAQQDRAADALRELEHALRLRPDDVRTHLELGALLARTGDARTAIQHFDRAAAVDPGDPRPLVESARVAFEQFGDIPRAVELLNRARALDPQRLETVVLASVIQFELAKSLARADATAGASAADPQSVRDAFWTAEMLAREAVRLGPRSAAAHANLGKVLAARSTRAADAPDALDQLNEAIFCFERAAGLDPLDPEHPRLRAAAIHDRDARRP